MSRVLRIKVDASGPIRMVSDAVRALEPPQITYSVRDAAKVYQQGMQRRAPRRTGRLANSVTIDPIDPYTYFVGPDPDLVYAPVQEYGAVIRPKRARALAFFVGGVMVFAKKVVVPASPYVRPTFNEDTTKAAEAFAKRFERYLIGGL